MNINKEYTKQQEMKIFSYSGFEKKKKNRLREMVVNLCFSYDYNFCTAVNRWNCCYFMVKSDLYVGGTRINSYFKSFKSRLFPETTTSHRCHLSKAVVLGEAVASDDDDIIVPGQDFSQQAHVPNVEKVVFFSLENAKHSLWGYV